MGVVALTPQELPADPAAQRKALKEPVFDAVDVELKASKAKPAGATQCVF